MAAAAFWETATTQGLPGVPKGSSQLLLLLPLQLVCYTHTRMVALQMSDFRLENLGSTGCTVRLDHQYTLKKKKKDRMNAECRRKRKKKTSHTLFLIGVNRGRLRSPGRGSLFFSLFFNAIYLRPGNSSRLSIEWTDFG